MSLQIYEYPLKCFVIIGRSKTASDLWEFKNDEERYFITVAFFSIS